ncbi:MAG TPA: hypothetical protein VEX43_08630 [Chthoniobacterales bacterium]|nr:hypothetical protein [Chthoniobacterales bacterium]
MKEAITKLSEQIQPVGTVFFRLVVEKDIAGILKLAGEDRVGADEQTGELALAVAWLGARDNSI